MFSQMTASYQAQQSQLVLIHLIPNGFFARTTRLILTLPPESTTPRLVGDGPHAWQVRRSATGYGLCKGDRYTIVEQNVLSPPIWLATMLLRRRGNCIVCRPAPAAIPTSPSQHVNSIPADTYGGLPASAGLPFTPLTALLAPIWATHSANCRFLPS